MAIYNFYQLERIADIRLKRVPLVESEFTINGFDVVFAVIANPNNTDSSVISREYAIIYRDEFIPIGESVYPSIGAKYISVRRRINGFDTVFLGVLQDDN